MGGGEGRVVCSHKSDGRSITGGFKYMEMKKNVTNCELKNRKVTVRLMFISAQCAEADLPLFSKDPPEALSSPVILPSW